MSSRARSSLPAGAAAKAGFMPKTRAAMDAGREQNGLMHARLQPIVGESCRRLLELLADTSPMF